VKQIARVARDPSNDMPLRPIKITHIETHHAGMAAKPATTPKAATGAKKPM
jgi:hypothetical protein